MDIAQVIKWHRENLNFSSKQVALELNINQYTYSKIESAKRIITITEFKKIVDFFNLTMDELYVIPTKRKVSF